MEIKRAQQSFEITKVQTDRREEVKDTKPVVPNHTRDSFEDAKVRKDSTSQTANSNESAKTVDPKSQEILLNQITSARLLESGIKRPQEKPIATKKELGTDEQNAANSTAHKVPDSNDGMDAGTSYGPRVPQGAYAGDARSRIGEADQALRDLIAKGGTDLNPKDNSAPSHGGPGGSYTAGNPLEGGPTGPSNPMDSVNQKYAEAKKWGDLNSLGSAAQALRDDINSADQSPAGGYGKDMVATGSLGIDPTQAEIDAAKKGPQKTEEKEEPSTWEKVKAEVKSWWTENKDDVKDAAVGATIDAAEEAARYVPGASTALQGPGTVEEVTGDSTDLMRGAELIGKMKAGQYQGMGSGTSQETEKKPGASTSEQEEYERQEFEKHKEEVRNALGDLGIDPFALPKRPVIQGDIDPPEDQQTGSGEYQPGLLQQFGKEGLVGNPTGVDGHSPGGSINLGQRGGNIDYEDGSGYMGPERTEDPQDVDVSGAGSTGLNIVSRDEVEDEEEEENQTTTRKKKA